MLRWRCHGHCYGRSYALYLSLENSKTTQTISGLCAGTYTVTVTDAGNCQTVTTANITQPVGINEQTASIIFSIFPNPTNGSFTISIEIMTAEKIQIKIYTILGETVYSSMPETASGKYFKEINLGSKANGMYFVHLSAGEKTGYQKLIIK